MIVQDIRTCTYRRALDGSILCELLHPRYTAGADALQVSIAHAVVPAGESTLPHRLKTSREVYYILSGEGILTVNREDCPVRAGQAVLVPCGAFQHIQNTGSCDLSFLVICDPPWSAEAEELADRYPSIVRGST